MKTPAQSKATARRRDDDLDVLRADAAVLKLAAHVGVDPVAYRLAALRDRQARQLARGRADPQLQQEITAAARHLERLQSAKAPR